MTATLTRFDFAEAVRSTAGRTAAPRTRGVPRCEPVHAQLVAAIEEQIVPRLLVSRVREVPVRAVEAHPVLLQEVLDLAAFAVAHDAEATRHYLIVAAGDRAMETVCFDLLAPAARHLGLLWEEDLCSFTDVTLGMLHLQHALHGLSPLLPRLVPEGFRRRRILLAPVPGEQHTFGLSVVEAFFLRAGWNVTMMHGASAAELRGRLGAEWFAVLGLSAGSHVQAGPLAREVPRLRRVSRNTNLAILIGGPVFAAEPSLAHDIGADGTAADGLQATWLAENLLGARAQAP